MIPVVYPWGRAIRCLSLVHYLAYSETKRKCHYFDEIFIAGLYHKLSKWQLPMYPVTKMSAKWKHSRVCHFFEWYIQYRAVLNLLISIADSIRFTHVAVMFFINEITVAMTGDSSRAPCSRSESLSGRLTVRFRQVSNRRESTIIQVYNFPITFKSHNLMHASELLLLSRQFKINE